MPSEVIPPPEILLPRRRSNLSDESLDQLATILDECFHIPGTRFRIGVDAIVGLIPGVGDLIGGLLSFIIVGAAWARGIPKVGLLRMMVNVALDVVVGALPFLGDAFDAYWKVNRRNFNLLMAYQRTAQPNKQIVRDWLFLLLLAVVGFVIVCAPLAVIWLLIHWLRS
ncbi:MAG TPA: DUF4112 domain-containing protein [Terriglobales bacterium]